MEQVLCGARVFDGKMLRDGMAVILREGRIAALVSEGEVPNARALTGGILAPGFVDLQVNGGGGALLGRGGDPATELATICAAHARLGATAILPTLITARSEVTRAVLVAGVAAARAGVPGFLGLHLEGPHLDPRRAGAHDPALMHPLDDADIAAYADAARVMRLMITLAPEAATPEQITALTRAGVTVSLGHSDCTETQARAAMAAGARLVTHLYNAMSPLSHRAPGLVGAALDGSAWVGIIPDGVHVSAPAFRIAQRAAGARLFAVSDAMAVAGSDLDGFDLDGRRIHRRDGCLTLDDGTLAGADIDGAGALRWMVDTAGLDLTEALAMLSTRPAQALGLDDRGRIVPGMRGDLVWLGDDLTLRGVWQGGERV